MFKLEVSGETLKELETNIKKYYEEFVDINEDDVIGEDAPVPPVIKAIHVSVPPVTEITNDEGKALEATVKELVTPAEVVKKIVDATFDGEIDDDGVPWDKRIHASSKAVQRNGKWRKRRNLDPNVYDRIYAEIKGSMEQLANPTPIPAAPITTATPIVKPVVAVVTAPVIPAVNNPTDISQPAPPVLNTSGGHTVESFKANFAMILGNLISEGKIKQDYVNTLKDYFKVEQIWDVTDEQKAEMFESFVGYNLIVKVG